MILQCRHCGTPVTLSEPLPRDAECSGCGKDLRACVQCRHYDTAYNNSCRETMADPVTEKDRRNFCEYFSFSQAPFQASSGSTRESDARAKLNSLFGGTKKSPSEGAKKRLEDLFKKPGSGDVT